MESEQCFDCFSENSSVCFFLSTWAIFWLLLGNPSICLFVHFLSIWATSWLLLRELNSMCVFVFFFYLSSFCLFVYLSHILITSERTASVCRSWRWLRGRRERGGGGAFNFLFNLPPTLIPPLLYFGIIFGFAPSLTFANAVVTIWFWGNCPDCSAVCEVRFEDDQYLKLYFRKFALGLNFSQLADCLSSFPLSLSFDNHCNHHHFNGHRVHIQHYLCTLPRSLLPWCLNFGQCRKGNCISSILSSIYFSIPGQFYSLAMIDSYFRITNG